MEINTKQSYLHSVFFKHIIAKIDIDSRDYNILLCVSNGLTFNEIGDEMNLSSERIRQIYNQIISHKLDPYFESIKHIDILEKKKEKIELELKYLNAKVENAKNEWSLISRKRENFRSILYRKKYAFFRFFIDENDSMIELSDGKLKKVSNSSITFVEIEKSK